jgi:hypothetical protein
MAFVDDNDDFRLVISARNILTVSSTCAVVGCSFCRQFRIQCWTGWGLCLAISGSGVRPSF